MKWIATAWAWFTTGSVVRTPFVLPSSATGGSHLGNLGVNESAHPFDIDGFIRYLPVATDFMER